MPAYINLPITATFAGGGALVVGAYDLWRQSRNKGAAAGASSGIRWGQVGLKAACGGLAGVILGAALTFQKDEQSLSVLQRLTGKSPVNPPPADKAPELPRGKAKVVVDITGMSPQRVDHLLTTEAGRSQFNRLLEWRDDVQSLSLPQQPARLGYYVNKFRAEMSKHYPSKVFERGGITMLEGLLQVPDADLNWSFQNCRLPEIPQTLRHIGLDDPAIEALTPVETMLLNFYSRIWGTVR